jgi:hypothetical protein
LRDKAHAWFKINPYSFETVSLSEELYSEETFVVDGHIYSWYLADDTATIVPILPQPSQKTVKRDWSPGTLFPAHSRSIGMLMDPAQNLIVTAYGVFEDASNHETFYIDLRTLDNDSVHPKAAGPTLFLPPPPVSENHLKVIEDAKLKGIGRYIAFGCSFVVEMWQLYIWDWQHSTTSIVSLFVSRNLRNTQ